MPKTTDAKNKEIKIVLVVINDKKLNQAKLKSILLAFNTKMQANDKTKNNINNARCNSNNFRLNPKSFDLSKKMSKDLSFL